VWLPAVKVLAPIGPAGYAGWAAIAASYVLIVAGRRGHTGLFWVALGLHLVMLDAVLGLLASWPGHSHVVPMQVACMEWLRRRIAAQIVPVFASGPLILLHLGACADSIPPGARRQLYAAFFALADILLLIGWLAAIVRR